MQLWLPAPLLRPGLVAIGRAVGVGAAAQVGRNPSERDVHRRALSREEGHHRQLPIGVGLRPELLLLVGSRVCVVSPALLLPRAPGVVLPA